MTIEANPSSRMQVRGANNLMHPGHCAICGSGDSERTYLDPSIFFDFEGQVYICVEYCLREILMATGALPPDEVQFLNRINDELSARNTELEKVKVQYDRLIVALRDGVSDLSITDSSDIISEPVEKQQLGDKLTNDEPTINREAEFTKHVKSVTSGDGLSEPARTTGSDGDSSRTEPVPNFRL